MRGPGLLLVMTALLVARGASAGPPPPPPILEDEEVERDQLPEDVRERANAERRLEFDGDERAPDDDAEAEPVLADAWGTSLAQIGVGLGVAAGLAVLTSGALAGLVFCGPTLLGSGMTSLAACGVMGAPVFCGPAIVGAVETWVGNRLSGRDVSAMLPVATAYGGLVVGGIGAIAGTALMFTAGGAFINGGFAGISCLVASCTGLAALLVLPVVLLPTAGWAIASRGDPPPLPPSQPPGGGFVRPPMPY